MRQELYLPPLTEEEALRRIIKSLKGAGRSLDPVNYPDYGHELYIPNVVFQCLHEVQAKDREIHPTGMRSYEMNPNQPGAKVFYDAAWILCQAGLLRPDPPNPNANGSDINKGFTVTSKGKQWLSHISENEPEITKLVVSKDGLILADVAVDDSINQSSIPTLRKDNADEGDETGNSLASTILDASEGPLLNNRYKILHTLSSGGFGKTYLAEDTFLPSKRRCVIKQLTFLSNDPDVQKLILERFEREAAILEKLGNSNEQIPKLYAHFSENGQYYLVQEWIRGETITKNVVLNGAYDETAVRNLLISILQVLEYIHSNKIIHRDIKPENVMLREEDGKPVLIDFGAVKEIARTVVDPFGNPTTTIFIGTPAFVPMEQATGRPVFASDIYSLALTAIFMLTGKRPQELTDLRTGDVAWHEDAKDVSAGFAAILDKAINPSFRERFPTARDMLDALSQPQTQESEQLLKTTVLDPVSPGGSIPRLPTRTGESSDTFDEALFYAPPEVVKNTLASLLERERQITISRYIQSAGSIFYRRIMENPPADSNRLLELRNNHLLPILDSLVAIGAALIEYKQWELFSEVQKVFYLLCRRAEKNTDGKLRLSKTWLWQEVIIRVYSLGALLVYREDWEQAKSLIEQEVDWDDDYFRGAYWARYFLIMVSRADELKDQSGWVVPAIKYIGAHPWFSDLFMSDEDEITNAVIHFDFLQCVYVLANPEDVHFDEPYPGFATFDQRKVEPILIRLITDRRLRDTLASISDMELAQAVKTIINLTRHVPNRYIGWGDYWSDRRIKQFLQVDTQ